jgi:hypothetical protein
MKYRRRRSTRAPSFVEGANACLDDLPIEIQAYCQKWTLRVLVDLGGAQKCSA